MLKSAAITGHRSTADKVVEYTEMSLDDCAMYFWGVPLSMIAAASALWGYKVDAP